MTSRKWCFTLNNPTEDDLARVSELVDVSPEPSVFRWIVGQLERGESGTPHLQGTVHFTSPVRLTGARTALGFPGGSPHLEPQRGDNEQARAYVAKPSGLDSPADEYSFEFGAPSSQGARTDLAAFEAGVREGRTLQELAQDHFGVLLKYPAGARLTHGLFNTAAAYRGPVEVRLFFSLCCSLSHACFSQVVVLFGASGAGKTRAVYDRAGDHALVYPVPEPTSRTFFDGYHDQPIILLDDFSCRWFPLTELLKLLDRYPHFLHTKGGSAARFPNFRPRPGLPTPVIYLTSNVAPWRWYRGVSTEQYRALLRRFSKILYYARGEGGFFPPPVEVDDQTVFNLWSGNAPDECSTTLVTLNRAPAGPYARASSPPAHCPSFESDHVVCSSCDEDSE